MPRNLQPKAYYADENTSVPGKAAPDYEQWNADYYKKLFDAFGGSDVQFDEKRIPLSSAALYSLPLHEPRVKLYHDMLRAGEKLPPLVVQKEGGKYRVLDGLHRYHAAARHGLRTLNAILVSPAAATGQPGKKHWLRSGDGFSLPRAASPDRAAWDSKYMERVKAFFGPSAQYRPFNAAVADLDGTHSVMSGHPRTDFYARMYRQGERVPPVVVARQPTGRYSVLDGNRRLGSADMVGVSHVPAVEVIDPDSQMQYGEAGGGDAPDPDPFGTGAPKRKMKKAEREGIPQGYGESVKHPKLPKRLQAVFDAVRDPEVLVERTEDGSYLRAPRYRGHPNRFAGHCYAATEALYHLMNGKETGWKVRRGHHENDTHWWLYHPEHGVVLDPTAEQFKKPVPYGKLKTRDGRDSAGGFLTKEPSKRARIIMERALKKLGNEFKLQKAEALSGFTAKNREHPNLARDPSNGSMGGYAQPKSGTMMKSPAFRHNVSGQIVESPFFHNVENLPGGMDAMDDWEDGFIDHSGKFYNRGEAAAAVNANTLSLESQDYAVNAVRGIWKDEFPYENSDIGYPTRDGKGIVTKDMVS